ncbi:alpha/beta hydrolase [Amycolatopsis cihanbeyliensis]|uniref:Alpha-beta hydrolase superfamily lysophospholipase n=1 Tax=Amycolatopsis cihanbeyliensis TaxID=1128664 RepID=A0A542DH80_AMYCI|nr:alpha/beta hydrolase [Amycolatopsis cihanbeyliensis]TQJ02459.1 alpha-beta hydrolase superfamily lysophospholipase [Amycolatopsis cihanbeyliensis]
MRWFQHGRRRTGIGRLGVLLLALLGGGLLIAPAHARAGTASCEDMEFPVSVLGLPYTMSGTLCVPPDEAGTVQVLIPGGFYNSTYWDIPVDQETRSFRRAMNEAGYATLTVDRLGTGRSSAPPSAVLTAITQANAVHQVVRSLRTGTRGPRFEKVILGGHSLGSAIAIIEAGIYHDVDGVLVTGMAHRLNLTGLLPVFTTFVPAVLDPAFSGKGLDPGYLTTMPGTRFGSLHEPGPYVDAVAAFEESTKDVAAPTELVDAALLGTVTPFTLLVDVPVLTVMASEDPTFCGPLATDCGSAEALLRSERPFYSPAAQLQAHVVPGYGHSLNYSTNAPRYHDTVVRWADQMIGG